MSPALVKYILHHYPTYILSSRSKEVRLYPSTFKGKITAIVHPSYIFPLVRQSASLCKSRDPR